MTVRETGVESIFVYEENVPGYTLRLVLSKGRVERLHISLDFCSSVKQKQGSLEGFYKCPHIIR